MALFQTSVLKTYLAQQDNSVVERAYKKYTKYFHNATIQENIKNSKEEQYQAKFLDELFVNVLGYTLNPKPNFNITTEFKNQKGAGKADGAILKETKAIGVIELKGTNTKDLESIRKQAFDYKANQKGCVYVITSNFEKLRFYINDATEFLEFNLFQLAPEEFALMHLCLQKDNILNNLPLTIKEASLVEEDKITKQFYNDYSVFKRELFRDLVKRNAKRLKQNVIASEARQSHNGDDSTELKALEKNVKLSLFKKSQKLIDRFLFIFFAEDRDLLPPNSTIQILDKWKADIDFGDERPLYNLFKQYFHFLDEGRKGTTSRAEIYAYNGGLFKPDAILDSLEIDDDLLYKHTYKLAKYDFSSQVDVNILGHIFENSLNEIESVNAEIEGGEFDKQKSKRKKDGVFYTPKYITKYIVENTVGKLCQEKKDQLGFKEEAYFEIKKGTHQNTKKQLLEVLDNYRAWLLQITICDPACGSGAFLNQALDFLIKEHRYIDELKAKVLGGGLILSDIENTILENNIYGVDLNEESVEIAKLSLWLRTAQPRRKLNDLSSNIKCGNSLIDSKTVAGDKAFNWHQEFPQIFDKGGFDVIIGNPPYVRVQFLEHTQIDWFKKNKKVAHKRIDISLMFFELASAILRENGLVSFITSNQFLTTEYGRNCRKLLLKEFKIERLIDFADLPVFEGALTYVSIFTLRNNKPTNFNLFNVESLQKAQELDFGEAINIQIKNLTDDSWTLKDSRETEIIEKIKLYPNLKNIGNCNYGIVSGNDSVFIVDANDLALHSIEDGILLPLLRAENCGRYKKVEALKRIIYPYKNLDGDTILFSEEELMNNFPNAYAYLNAHKKTLEERKDSRKTLKGAKDWYKLTRFGTIDMFNKTKIVYPGETKNNKFGIDYNKSGYSGARVFSITLNSTTNYEDNLLALLALLNSKLVEFYLHSTSPLKQGGYYSYSSTILNTIPIPEKYETTSLKEKSLKIIELYSTYDNIISKFTTYLLHQYNELVVTRKLDNWHELDFVDFIKELNKAIKKAGGTPLTKKDEFEWLELFEDNKKKAQELQTQITQTEKTIDTMVYDLYSLTQEEREIVENS